MAWRLACARLHIHHSSGSFTPLASQPGTPPTSSHPPAQSKHRGRAQRTQRQQRQRRRRPEARKEGLKSREGSPEGAHGHTGSEGRGSRRRQSYLESGGSGIKIDERVPRRQVCLPWGWCTPQGDKVGEEGPETGASRAQTDRNKRRERWGCQAHGVHAPPAMVHRRNSCQADDVIARFALGGYRDWRRYTRRGGTACSDCAALTLGVTETGVGTPDGAAPHAAPPSSDRFSRTTHDVARWLGAREPGSPIVTHLQPQR